MSIENLMRGGLRKPGSYTPLMEAMMVWQARDDVVACQWPYNMCSVRARRGMSGLEWFREHASIRLDRKWSCLIRLNQVNFKFILYAV